jgi:D-alanyl-D-alanine carboxypeptidase/D-alanyl-D-alanine-endopeptidase (penicillin-binding protein 4)
MPIKIKIHAIAWSFLCLMSVFLMGCTPHRFSRLYSKNPGFYAGIVGGIDQKDPDWQQAAQVHITPASCLKVVTTLLALKELGSEYRYTTQLFIEKRGKSIRNARIAFSGDPLLSSKQLSELLQPLAHTRIAGCIFLDCSMFQTPEYSSDWMIGDIGTGYATPVSAMNIDANLITVHVQGNIGGKKAQVQNDMNCPMAVDVAITGEPTKIALYWKGPILHVKGCLNAAQGVKIYKISPNTMRQYALAKIKKIMKSLHIKGKVVVVSRPTFLDQEFCIALVKSLPLRQVLAPALKTSHNLFFDALYLTLIHRAADGAGLGLKSIQEWSSGDPIIKSLLKKHFDLDMSDALFVDGSGLSRYNHMQPCMLFSLLKKGFSMPEWISLLPQCHNVESAIKTATGIPLSVFAKSGTLYGIRGLCGYILHPQYPKAFVVHAYQFSLTKSSFQSELSWVIGPQLITQSR